MRKIILAYFAFVLGLFIVAGCANMTTQQKQDVTSDVLVGLQIVAAGVAGMPGSTPTEEYWSKYATGVLSKTTFTTTANPTSAQ